MDHFDAALRHNPENTVAIYGLVQMGFVLNRLVDLVEPLSNLLEAAPAKSDVRFSLAGCLAKLGRTDEAAQHLETILQQDPENAHAQELYAEIAA